MDDENVADFLAHFGVKGMRWGVRRQENAGSTKPSRKERKQAEKERVRSEREAAFNAHIEKARGLVQQSLKDPDTLVLLNGRQIVTGREFVQHMTNGGLMDVNTTRVYATIDKTTKKYVVQG